MSKKKETNDPPKDIDPQPNAEIRDVPQMPGQRTISSPLRKSIMNDMLDNADEPMLIIEQIESAQKLAKQTGQRIRRRFNKKEFVRQFPQAGTDPRFAFTPDYFQLDISPMATLTVGELRDLCIKTKGHPLSLQKALQVEGLGDSTVIHILKEEYNILTVAAK